MQQQKWPLLAFSGLARSPKIQLTKTSSQQFQCEKCPFQSPRFTGSLSRSTSAAPHRWALHCPSFQGELSLLCFLCFSAELSVPHRLLPGVCALSSGGAWCDSKTKLLSLGSRSDCKAQWASSCASQPSLHLKQSTQREAAWEAVWA